MSSQSPTITLDLPDHVVVVPQHFAEEAVISGIVKLLITDSSGLTIKSGSVVLVGTAAIDDRMQRIVSITETKLLQQGSSVKLSPQPAPHELPFVIRLPQHSPPSFAYTQSEIAVSVSYMVALRLSTGGMLSRREIAIDRAIELAYGPDFEHDEVIGEERTGFHSDVGTAVLLVPHSVWAASDTLTARLLLQPASKEPLRVEFSLERRVGKRGVETVYTIMQGQPLQVRVHAASFASRSRMGNQTAPQLARMLAINIPQEAIDVSSASVGLEVRHRLVVRVHNTSTDAVVALSVGVRLVSARLLTKARRATMPTRLAVCGIIELREEVKVDQDMDVADLLERKRLATELPHYFEHPRDLLLMLPSGEVNAGMGEKQGFESKTSGSPAATPLDDLNAVPDYQAAYARDGLTPLWSLRDLPDYVREPSSRV